MCLVILLVSVFMQPFTFAPAAKTPIQNNANARPYLEEPLEELVERIPELKKLQPAPNQQLLPTILSKTGARVDDFLRNVVNLTAHEAITQETRNAKGAVKTSRQLEYNYLVLLHRTDLSPTAEEYRTDLKGNRVEPGGVDKGYTVTSGFALECLHFLPSDQPYSTFRYLGDDVIGARNTYVVAFAQHPDRATSTSFVTLAGGTVPTFVQGIAWIDKSSYQIIRMRTDLLEPLSLPSSLKSTPKSHAVLDQQTTEVTFTEVQLLDVAKPLWLPSEVNVYAVFSGEAFRNQHSYTNYRRFRVSAKMRPYSTYPL